MHTTLPVFPVSSEEREARQGHAGGAFWFTGLSGSGKSTLCRELERKLFDSGYQVTLLDGDVVRRGLCRDLGFSAEDRRENIRRVAELSGVLARQGMVVLCAFIAPLREYRESARQVLGPYFHEVFVQCPLNVCEQRDVKGLYALARQGKIADFTGLSAPYEEPLSPDLALRTDQETVEHCVAVALDFIVQSTRRAKPWHEMP